jgi:hypothetical protein
MKYERQLSAKMAVDTQKTDGYDFTMNAVFSRTPSGSLVPLCSIRKCQQLTVRRPNMRLTIEPSRMSPRRMNTALGSSSIISLNEFVMVLLGRAGHSKYYTQFDKSQQSM